MIHYIYSNLDGKYPAGKTATSLHSSLVDAHINIQRENKQNNYTDITINKTKAQQLPIANQTDILRQNFSCNLWQLKRLS